MKKMILSVIIFNLLLSCDPWDDRTKIINNSKHKIFFMSTFQDIDTIWITDYIKDIKKYDNSIKPDSIFNFGIIGRWPGFVNSLPQKKLYIWFLQEEFFTNYEKYGIMDTNYYVKKAYSDDDLKKLDWKIVYTGK